jgi:hypothetical protein
MTTQALDQAGANVEPEAGPADPASLCDINLGKSLEDPQVEGWIDPGAIVFNHEANPFEGVPNPCDPDPD